MTYNERLNDLAEKMAKEFHATDFAKCLTELVGKWQEWDDISDEAKATGIEVMLPLAAMWLEEMAKEVKKHSGHYEYNTQFLKENGLIP